MDRGPYPIGRWAVSKESYDVLLKALEREQNARQKEAEAFSAEKLNYRRKLALLADHANDSTNAHGTNSVCQKTFQGYDHSNAANIKTFLKFTFMPYHKFPHSSWAKFDPDNRNSFFRKIIPELDMPEHCVPFMEWKDKQVPLISKGISNWRSIINSATKATYLGKCVFTSDFMVV